MRGLRFLQRSIYVLESLQTMLMCWCLSLPLLFLAQPQSGLRELIWGLCAAVPVLLIREAGLRLDRRLLRLAAGLAVTAIAAAVSRDMVRVCYAACGLIATVVATWFPRPDGKLVLSVPKVWHALFMLMTYAIGQITQNPLLISTAIALALIFTVNFLLYYNASRLLNSLRDDPDAAVSGQNIVSLNRRLMLGFALGGTLLILAVPWLLDRSDRVPGPPPEAPLYQTDSEETTASATGPDAAVPAPSFKLSPGGFALPWAPVETGSLLLFLLLGLAVVALTVLAVFLVIDMLRDDRDKHRPPKENRFIVEELPKQTRQADLSAPAGTWQKRIRKQYRQLISGRADPEDLSPLSPRELEAFTGLPDSEDRRTLHGLYEQARYSSLPCTREDYRAAKAAAKALAAERRAAKP